MFEKIIKRPVLAIIFFLIIILMGIYSINNSPIEKIPNPDKGLPSLNVFYSWDGASPSMILKRVVLPAEAEIMQIKGVSSVESNSSLSRGILKVRFTENSEMNFVTVVLAERLNRLQKDLPREVSKAEIQPYIPKDFRKEPFFNIGCFGDMSIFALKKIVDKNVLPYLKGISGISSIDVEGGVEPEIKIFVDLNKIKKYGLSIYGITRKISSHFFNEKSLTLKQNKGEITLSLSDSPKNLSEIGDIAIIKKKGAMIKVKDVALVYQGYQEIVSEQRYQGMPVIGLRINKESGYSSMKLAKNIRKKLESIANKIKVVKFGIQNDDSKDLKRRLITLVKISILTLIIIFVILMIIIKEYRASLLIFSSVFFSVFATFTAIYIFKIPLNILTLSGLALGFGLFVDNAVVVFDSILRFREEGYSQKESAIKGASTVVLPVISSTLTTIIVFFSFALFFDERLSVFYLPLAYVIAVSLSSSIIVSFVLIPSLAARINIKTKATKKEFKKGKFFLFIFNYPLTIIVPILLISIFAGHLFFKNISFNKFFNFDIKEKIFVHLSFPIGTEFKDVKEAIKKFEDKALEKPYKKDILTNIHKNSAYMYIDFPPSVEKTGEPLSLKKELCSLAANLAGIGVQVSGFDQEPYYYSPDSGSWLAYKISIKGYNLEKLLDYCNKLKKNLLKNRRIKEVEIITDIYSWWNVKNKYYSISLKRDKLDSYKIEPRELFYILSSMLHQKNSSYQKIKFDEKDMNVVIKSKNMDISELYDMQIMELKSFNGKNFRLKDVATIKERIEESGITRKKQQYEAEIQWDYLGSSKAAKRYYDTIYDNLVVPPGFEKGKDLGRNILKDKEKKQLQSAIYFSIVLIYLILCMLYENLLQPFLIMLSIPLSLLGVIIAFLITDYAFDSTARIGLILLFGIVVNNAIILIDNINLKVKKHKNLIKGIIIGTKERIRPIFMTSATTVLGMLPMILIKGSSSKSDIWSSLALCTIGGLTTSAILIIVFLPLAYFYLFKLQHFISKKNRL